MTINSGYEYREQVGVQARGLTAIDWLSRRYVHSSGQDWMARIERGEILVNGAVAQSGTVLKPGMILTWMRPPWDEPEAPLHYGILHEDAHLLAVSKPGGLPTLPGGGFLDHTLLALIRRDYPEAAPIHRLGRGTSGIVLFARTLQARSLACSSMRNRKALKVYRALASGVPPVGTFTVNVPIGPVEHPALGTVHAASPTGRSARSRVRLLEKRNGCSLLEVVIETGRPHQVRIHLASAGLPLAGDPLYAAGGGILPQNPGLPGDTGYLLHASRLSMTHPGTGAVFEVSCEPPPELQTSDPACGLQA